VSARAIRSALVAAAAARLSYSALRSRPPGGPQAWSRTNHRGEPVTLLEGPAAAIGGIAGALAGPGTARERVAVAIAGAGAGAFGIYDDHSGNEANRGLRGHLGALLKGELTTGSVKVAGIGATALAAALAAGSDAQSGPGAVADTVINAALIAGGANLLNLFDLRPGRAIKVAAIAAALVTPAGGGGASAAPVAAAAALLPEDLGERAMLGDGGANALGAMLGTAAATSLSRPARIAALGVVAGLTVASEYVSFTKVIERTALLHKLDMLGRRPAAAPDANTGGEPAEAGTAGTGRAQQPEQHSAVAPGLLDRC
jgi:UDP-N-acetylmuramyl pentapeptide phosphotransferase/UDP-N-acetylglucosamine-1-phosphate transferase